MRCEIGPDANPPCKRCKHSGIECQFEKPQREANLSAEAGEYVWLNQSGYQPKDLTPLKGAYGHLRVTSASSGRTTRHFGLRREKSSASSDSSSISLVAPHLTGVPIRNLKVVREPPRLSRGVHLDHFLPITQAIVIRCHPCQQRTHLNSVRTIPILLHILLTGRPNPYMDGHLDCLLCIRHILNRCHLSGPLADQCQPPSLPFVPTRPTSHPQADDKDCTRLVRPQTSCIQITPVNSPPLKIIWRRRTMNCRRRAWKNHWKQFGNWGPSNQK